MPRHIKTQQKDAGVILTQAHADSPAIRRHADARARAIKSSPDISKKIAVNIPEIRAQIFINPGEDPVATVARYMELRRMSANQAQKKNGEYLIVES